MVIPNYQLIKEAEWYYLAKRRFILTNFVNADALNSKLVELKELGGHFIPLAPPPMMITPRGDKSSPGGKLGVGESTDDSKQARNISPLVLKSKDKVFDIGSEIIGRSSPLTIKPHPKVDVQSDGSAEKKREDRRSVDRSSGVFVEGVNLEEVSLLNRRKSKELVLKVKKSSTDSLESLGMRKSNEKVDTDISSFGKDNIKSKVGTNENASWEPEKDKGVTRSATIEDALVELKKERTKSKSDSVESVESVASKIGKGLSKDGPDSAKTEPANRKDSKVSVSDAVRAGSEDRNISLEKNGEKDSGGETRRSSATSDSKHSDDSVSVIPHRDGSVSSPLVTDVSIQLTKTDGRSECYIPLAEGKMGIEVDNSFEDDPDNEGILKRCSSFAGFRTETPCAAIKSEDESLSQAHSPVKGFHPNFVGPIGRFRHFSAPLSGQGTPKSRVSTLPQTPSWMSSRGSFTEDGKMLVL